MNQYIWFSWYSPIFYHFTLTRPAEMWAAAWLPRTQHPGNPQVHGPCKKKQCRVTINKLEIEQHKCELYHAVFLVLPLKLKHLAVHWHPCFYAIHHHRVLQQQTKNNIYINEAAGNKNKKLNKFKFSVKLTSLIAEITSSDDAGLTDKSSNYF